MHRRSFIRQGLALAAAQAIPLQFARAAEPPHSVVTVSDFDELWRTLAERYCYFGEKRTDWNAVRRLYRPQALAAQSDEAFQDVVTRVLAGEEIKQGSIYVPTKLITAANATEE